MSTRTSVFVHSTFRDKQGDQLIPHGLQWGLPGTSHVRFVIGNQHRQQQDPEQHVVSSPQKATILGAYNRWCFAKDLPYKTLEDIVSISPDGEHHFQVEWIQQRNSAIEKVIRHESIETLLRQDDAATGKIPPAEVWINGKLLTSRLDGSPLQLERILQQIPKTPNKLCYKRSSENGRIRIDRYYSSSLRRPQAWDHIWDNLVAMEDMHLLDHQTLIGTATLRDWIMGGNLTCRMWIRDDGDSILFLRPLRKDNVHTSDRRYELLESNKEDTEKMALARTELKRLRTLALLEHPVTVQAEKNSKEQETPANPLTDVRKKLRQNRNKSRFFGI